MKQALIDKLRKCPKCKSVSKITMCATEKIYFSSQVHKEGLGKTRDDETSVEWVGIYCGLCGSETNIHELNLTSEEIDELEEEFWDHR